MQLKNWCLPELNRKFLARFVLVSTAVAAVYVAYFWFDQLYTSPVELYHRVWQASERNYYDKTALGGWKKFEHAYDDKIKTTEDAILYSNKMLSSLGDPFTVLRSPAEVKLINELQNDTYVGIGVLLAPITASWNGTKYLAVVSVMPNSPALKAGLQTGDTIIKVMDTESAGMTVIELKSIVSKRENKPTPVLVRRGNRNIRFDLIPASVEQSNVELLASDKRFAHIVIKDFLKPNTTDRVMRVLRRTAHRAAIVLDLRDNPGGSVNECLTTASAFLAEGKLVTLRVRSSGAGFHNETYCLTPKSIEIQVTDEHGKIVSTRHLPRLSPIAAGRPMVVLVNHGSASAAEMLASTLQDHGRVQIVGTRSYGKGIAQSGLAMPNGTFLNFTCVHYFTPKGRFIGLGRNSAEAQSEGVFPDIRVSDVDSKQKPAVDAQLARAFESVRR